MATQLTVGTKNLKDLSLTELRELLDEKEVSYTKQAKQAGLIKLIMESGKFDTPRKDGGLEKDGKLVHPIHGEYIRCIVHPQALHNQNGSIYVGINKYNVQFEPRTPIKLPKGVIKFLKNATEAEHVFDANAISDNGNMGAHITVQKPKFVVEVLLDDEDEE
ncbi:MAG: hypothetical protein K0U20_09430 [Proteobacteria bacterium]|nr:hypothetical protein [Pseudomonadota bacterium]MCH9735802.1 hypothetical protein [Actinomycetes bacterium]